MHTTLIKAVFLFLLLFSPAVPSPSAMAAGESDGTTMGVNPTDQAVTKFLGLQAKLKNFAIVILVIGLVVAAIAAMFQKTGMAISVGIGAIILFGGVWILAMIQSGLQ